VECFVLDSTERTMNVRNALACAVLLTGCDSPAPEVRTREPSTGRELLESSAVALRDVSSVRYEFEVGGPEAAYGWVTGTAHLVRRTRLEDALILVRGTVHGQPAQGVEERSFAWASDGENAWSHEGNGAPVLAAPVGRGANTLSATAVYAIVPEFLEPDPYWRELDSASGIDLLPAEAVNGRLSDPVRVTYSLGAGFEAQTIWWIDRQDRLPRRGLWRAPFTGPQGIVMELRALEIGAPLSAGDLQPPEAPVAAPAAQTAAIGDVLSSWSLASSTGGRIDAQTLAGKVVVLDFWNTWCPVCRSLAPATRALALEFKDRPVQFLGVNILEMGDAVGYWRDSGASYPTLFQGEELGNMLDLPWQPAVAVLDREGVVRYKQLGASGDRTARVRAAVLAVLAQGGS
jgi:thiol-disulfide isomerase/thioredoxin